MALEIPECPPEYSSRVRKSEEKWEMLLTQEAGIKNDFKSSRVWLDSDWDILWIK